MSGLISLVAGRPKVPTIAGFRVQSSVYGVPIPIVYGTTRIAGNLIHMPAQPVLKSASQSKASRSTKGASGGEMYTAPMIIGLCEGPIAGIGNVWRDKDGNTDFTAQYANIDQWLLRTGTSSQLPWSFLTGPYASQAVPYQYLAYVANSATPLPSDSLSQYSWEIQGFLRFNPVIGGVADASPADILNDLLSNTQYGCGIAAAQIGSIAMFQDYCAAAGLFCSPAIDNQRPGSDWINEILEVGNTALVWSDGKIKFIPYGDVALTGNGHTYTPNTTPLYDLTDSDYLPRGGDLDPVLVRRKDPATAYNQVTVEYRDRAHDYNIATYTAQDQFAIDKYGAIPLPTLVLHSICDAQVAQQVAQLRLQREQNVLNQYLFKLGWRFSLVEPMDLLTLTDAPLGLSKTPVRVTEITENDAEQGFDFVAEEWPFGTASATAYATPNPTGTAPNANVAPGNTTTPIIFEGPTPLQSSPLEVWVGASGGPNWGGCDVYISVDNVNFTKVGRIVGKATFGVTTATLASNAAYPAIDTTHTLAVDLTASGGSLVAQSQAAFDNLVPLCYLGGREFVAFRDATLTSSFHYNLTHLYRGLYSSTIPASHGVASDFVFCDSAILRVPWPLGYVGQVLYFKFPAFNSYGAALQDISAVSSVSHTVGQDPVIPGAASTNTIPQGTVSVDANGVWSASVDGPSNAQSYRWGSLTGGNSSGFPSDATIAASGTLVNGRTFSVNAGGTLAFGQTVGLTIIPFTGAGGTGTQLPSIHLRGSYLSYSASKTVLYSFGAFKPDDSTAVYTTTNGALQNNGSLGTQYRYTAGFEIPQGCTITRFAEQAYSNPARGVGHQATVSLTLFSTDSTGGRTGLAVVGASAIGWENVVAFLSTSTTSTTFLMNLAMQNVDANSDGLFAWAEVTYTSPTPDKSL